MANYSNEITQEIFMIFRVIDTRHRSLYTNNQISRKITIGAVTE